MIRLFALVALSSALFLSSCSSTDSCCADGTCSLPSKTEPVKKKAS